jgi:hypothetical protein
MPKYIFLSLVVAGSLAAQQTAAPTNEPVGAARGENLGNYNVTQSFETGYRWRQVGGDLGMYRSVVNFGNGLRLLGSSLTVNSRQGHGHYFDELQLNTAGLGNDPYQSAVLRIQKNRLYRYDMVWRLNEYYNPGLLTAGSTAGIGSGGLHLMDTSRRLQDHDLTLLPQSPVQLRVGYSRNTENGPALSTAQEFDVNGAAFPVFRDVRREWNEYRLGATADVSGVKFTVLHRWDYFKDDTPYTLAGATGSGLAGDNAQLQQFRRSEPVHGANPGWLGNLLTQRNKWSANARLTYVSGQRDFITDELASGLSQFGTAATRRILVSGSARRPMLAGDLNLSFFPTGKLTVVNNTSVTSNRIDGWSTLSEFSNGTDLGATVSFRYLGIRTVANSTDLTYRASTKAGFYGGYRFSNRRIRSVSTERSEVDNTLHSGRIGIRLRPVKPFTINVDGEMGRADRPLTPVADRNYHAINARSDYRTRRLQLSASYRQVYNVNSPLDFSAYSSHTRAYGANASWSPRDFFSIDASYTKLHVDTLSSLAFFASTGTRPQLQTAYASYYVSNTHAGTLGTRFSVKRRADLLFGYSITRDAGDGRAQAIPPSLSGDPIAGLLSWVQTFPLSYQSPLARLSVRITPKLRWNAGWQFYRYAEQFHLLALGNQNFRAHTGYTSLLWSF